MFPFLRSISNARSVLAAALIMTTAVCGLAQDSPANVQQATVTIYRKGGDARVHPSVFAAGTAPVELDPKTYAQFQVSPVPMVVTSTVPIAGHLRASLPTPTGAWTRFLGCAAIDWQHWTSANPDNLEDCYQNLKGAWEGCGIKAPEGVDSPALTEPVPPSCEHELEGSANPYRLLMMVHLGKSVPFDVEPGESYFFRWSGKGRDTVLEQVDEQTARREMKRMHAAQP